MSYLAKMNSSMRPSSNNATNFGPKFCLEKKSNMAISFTLSKNCSLPAPYTLTNTFEKHGIPDLDDDDDGEVDVTERVDVGSGIDGDDDERDNTDGPFDDGDAGLVGKVAVVVVAVMMDCCGELGAERT